MTDGSQQGALVFPDLPFTKPRLVLRVGLIGHRPRVGRTLDEAVLKASILASLQKLLLELDRVKADHADVFAAEPPILRVMTGLAEGCDQIGAEAALALGSRAELDAILPFSAANCASFMGSLQARERFGSLLAQCGRVLAFDEAANDARKHDIGHLAQSEAILDHCDILLAVWDSRIAKGPAGTEATLRRAADIGIPALVIKLDGTGPFRLRAKPLEEVVRTPLLDKQPILNGEIGVLVRSLLAPPPRSDEHDKNSASAEHDPSGLDTELKSHGHPSGAEASSRQRLEDFLFETPEMPKGFFGGRWSLHRMFRKILGASRLTLRAAAPAFARGWSFPFAEIMGGPFLLKEVIVSGRHHGLETISLPDKGSGNSESPLMDDPAMDALLKRANWADALAVRYAELNRTAIIAVPFIGAIAVAMGLAAFVAAGLLDKYTGNYIKGMTLLFEAVLLLVTFLHFYRPAHKKHWHRRQVEYRVLAELSRQERLLHMAGFGGHLKRPGAEAKLPDEWIGWYIEATLRELGFANASLGPTQYAGIIRTICEKDIQEQIAYNRNARQEAHQFGGWLSIFAYIFFLVLVALGLIGAAWLLYHGPADKQKYDLAAIAPDLLTALMAYIPAVIAAIHSVRGQLELEEQTRRTSHTELKLIEIEKQFNKALEAPIGHIRARRLLMLLNDALSSDLTGWSTVYRHKAPETPG